MRNARNGAGRCTTLPTTDLTWKPPVCGFLKINFDATFINGLTVTGCVLRNEVGVVLGAWVHRFSTDNPFWVESVAVGQALKIATSQQLDEVIFEGDAAFVIFPLNGHSDFEDWRAKKILSECKSLLAPHLFWHVSFAPRSCNIFAHCLAKWAFNLNFSGFVPPHLLNPTIWGVRDVEQTVIL